MEASFASHGWGDLELTLQRDQTQEIRTSEHAMSFHQAAKQGDACVLESALKLIHKSTDAHMSTQYYRKILHIRLNAKDDRHMSALHYAAQHNHVHICDLLMRYSVPKNKGCMDQVAVNLALIEDSELNLLARNDEDATPLHFASSSAQTQEWCRQSKNIKDKKGLESFVATCLEKETTVKKLLDWGEDWRIEEMVDRCDMTPLHWAARKGNIDAAIKLLLFQPKRSPLKWKLPALVNLSQCFAKSNHSLLNAKDNHGLTALHLCAWHNTPQVARVLIEFGADIVLQDRYGKSPLHYAALEGNVEIGKLLFERSKELDIPTSKMVEVEDSTRQTALHMAARKNHTEFANWLLSIGGSELAKKVTATDNTACHFASAIGNLSIVKACLELHCEVDQQNNKGKTSLHLAANCNQLEVIKHLVEKGAQLNCEDKQRMTPVMAACRNGNTKCAEYLILKGSSILSKDRDKMTSLHWASLKNRVDVIQMLNKCESMNKLIDKKNHRRQTSLHLASTRGHHRVVEVLIETCNLSIKDSEGLTAIHLAAKNGHVKVIELILARDQTQILNQSEVGNTPLMEAAESGKEEVVKLLVKNRANVDSRNRMFLTALVLCAMSDYTRCARILLNAGATMDFNDSCTINPLHIACENGSTNMVKVLLQQNAPVSAVDEEGNNALDVAIKHGHKACVRAIIDSSKWKAAIRSSRYNPETQSCMTTPLRELIRAMPDIAQIVFTKCTQVSPNRGSDHREYNIKFDFEFVDDAYSVTTWKSLQASGESATSHGHAPCFEMSGLLNTVSKPYTNDQTVLRNNHPLAVMVKYGNTDLLSHPLVKTLLQFKWNKYGRLVYYALLMVYSFYLLCLTLYFLALPPPYSVQIIGSGKNACFVVRDGGNPIWNLNKCNCCQYGNLQNGFMMFLAVAIGTLSCISLFKEIFQFWQARLGYLSSLDNYLEVISYVLALIVIIDWSEQTSVTGIKENWQWQLAAVCMLSSWLTLALFVRKLPTLGIYVIMLLDILKTFAKFMVTLMLFTTAFGLFFYMMLQNEATFHTTWQSMVKTSVMMIGELDYAGMFFADDITICDEFNHCVTKPAVAYKEVTIFVYLLFLIMMPIITMNLLVGLAVDDIKSIQEQATKQKMVMQINLALDVEFLIPEMARKHLTVGSYKMFPNKNKEKGWLKRMLFEDQDLQPEGIIKVLQSDEETKGMLLEQSSNIAQENQKIRKNLEELMQQTKQLTEVVNQLTKKLPATVSDV